MKVVEERRI